MRRKIAAGNWKMNGLVASLGELDSMIAGIGQPNCDVLICPPATLLAGFAGIARTSIVRIGGQNCHAAPSGAHTGETSAEMIKDAGGVAVLVGHSERRQDCGEDDIAVRQKAEAAWRAGLTAVVCIGETEAERDAGNALSVISGQLAGSVPDGATASNTVIAYEPVWAIGTGRTPTLEQIGEMHTHMRAELARRFGDEMADATRLLYGGSVKPGNAVGIFDVENVDGGLVGGASLKAEDFLPIVRAASGPPRF